MAKHLVAYARITEDRDSGITLQGVYFGGIGDTSYEAEQLARDCVNSIRGGTIMPKVTPLNSGQILDAMLDLTEKFEATVRNMVEADNIISRAHRRK